jgi:MFS transporter, AAHS family, 4-hydroxybenzoate transporter
VGGLVTALLIKTPLGSLGWQTLVLYMAAVCAALAGLLVFALPESPRYLLLRQPKSVSTLDILRRLKLAGTPTAAAEYSEPAHRGAFKALFADGRAIGTLLLWATFIGVCAVVSFFTSWLPLLYTYAGHDAAAGVSASAAYWTGGIVSGIVLPLFALRWHVDRVLLIASLGAAVACAGLGAVLSSGPAANLALAFACGIFISGAFYLLYPPAVHFYPTEIRSTGIGAAVAFGRLGNMLSPAAAGLLLGWGTTPTGIFLAMALLPALSVVAVAAFHRYTQSTQL